MLNRNDRWLSVILRTAPLLLFLWMVRSLLVPVALGALFALLLDPWKRRIVRKWPRLVKAAPVGLTVGAIVLVVIPFGLVAVRVGISAQAFLAGGLGQIVTRVQEFTARHFSGIAARLGITVNTANFHTRQVFNRLVVHDRSAVGRALIAAAARALPQALH